MCTFKICCIIPKHQIAVSRNSYSICSADCFPIITQYVIIPLIIICRCSGSINTACCRIRTCFILIEHCIILEIVKIICFCRFKLCICIYATGFCTCRIRIIFIAEEMYLMILIFIRIFIRIYICF